MADTPISSQIVASRDAIKTQIWDLIQQYMELENVDPVQSSFLSFLIDIMSTLTSNLMFYQTSVYREFFITQAQLPESVHNLSSFLGYQPSDAQYATVDLLIKFPLPFNDPNAYFTFPSGFQFLTTDGIPFVTYYDVTVQITGNAAAVVTANDNGRIYNLPVDVDTTAENQIQFVLPVRQYKIIDPNPEFQIDEDLQLFQFTDVEIPIDGKVASLDIYVKDPDAPAGSSGTLYTKFDSLYLMSSNDYGYVLRTTTDGKRVYFGNGLIGKQPAPGSTVIAHITETEGADGNIISGSIVQGARMYDNNGSIVNYTITNPSPATGGDDEESLVEIRNNSIAHLTTLNRLVSERDYKNIATVVEDSPIQNASLPVLKRSDVKVNEIQTFTSFNYENVIVPARNAYHTVPSATTYLTRNTIVDVDGTDYITLFEMVIDAINSAAYYHYILTEIDLALVLVQSYSNTYNLNVNDLNVNTSDTTSEVTFTLSYYSDEVDSTACTCVMKILSTDDEFTMTNVPGVGGGNFEYTFSNNLDIPIGSQTFLFTLSDPNPALLSQHSTTFTYRDDLKSFMLSNTVDDSTNVTIYDIPVIQKAYYDSIDKKAFESSVLQQFLSSMVLKDYRMLTDFANFKLANTTGNMTAMLRNTVTRSSVIDLGLTSVPVSPSLSDRYIVSGTEGGAWAGQRDKIALCTDATSVTWTFIEPSANDIVYVTNQSSKYIYTVYGWMVPVYQIPLIISLEVFKLSDSSITESALIEDIKNNIMDTLSPRFGPNVTIYRSEIIDIVQSTTGVSHCRMIKPESSIFFQFNLDDFDQDELLEYGPDWIYFTEDDISIKLLVAE